MRCKDGVNTNTLRPELLQTFPTIDAVYWAFNAVPIITSTKDGQHMQNSLHGYDMAFDLSIRHLGDMPTRMSIFSCLFRELNRLFPRMFDILHESKGTPNEHIHIEASPWLCGLIEGETKEV